ncbi:MAG: hypothetical protein NT097_05710 [Actinobacteria bacterium]|nr:hypothetical protein [Actinomycetota bacterium]
MKWTAMLTRSRFLQFVIASALPFAGFAVPLSPVYATVNVAPNGTQVALGQSHVAAIDSAGKVWTWGRIYPGNGGSGTWDTVTRPEEVTLSGSSFAAVSITAGEQSTLVATTNGDVYAWGYNGNGLGNGSGYQSPRSTPVKVSFPSGVRIVEVSGKCNGYLARSDQGAVYQWGSFYGMWNLSSTSPVIALAAGSVSGDSNKQLLSRGCSSAFAVKSDGSFFAWGANGGGKLGNGSTNDSATPISVSIAGKSVTQISASSTHTLALTSDGFVYAWGGNSNGQLARNPSSTSFLSSPARVGAIANAVSVSASESSPYSSLVNSTGVVSNWGSYFGSGSDASAYIPTALAAPSDLSTQLISGTGYQNGQAFVGQDGSIWTRGLYSNDGNCGADANSYSMWVNGRMQAPRTFVRVFSTGQFGGPYVEDVISVNSIKTAAGATLSLDGSGLVSALVGDTISLEASRPSSQCFSASELSYAWDLDADGEFDDAAVTSQDSFGNMLVSGSKQAALVQPRARGGLQISNEDGYVKQFSFDVRISAPTQNSGNVNSSLPYVARWYADNDQPGIAIGTNGKLYAWGSSDISDNGNSPLPSRVTTPVDDPNFTKIVGGEFYSSENMTSHRGSVAVALSASGGVYVWGSGNFAHPGTPGVSAPLDITRVSRPTLVTSPTNDAAVDILATYSRIIVLTESGRIWTWGRQSWICQNGPCNYRYQGPEEISELMGTDEILPGYQNTSQFFTRTGTQWSKVYAYNLGVSNSQGTITSIPNFDEAEIIIGISEDENIAKTGSLWKLEDGTTFDVPSGNVVDVNVSGEVSFLLEDGSIWKYTWVDLGYDWRRVASPGTAVRFAGQQLGWQEIPGYINALGQIKNAGGTCSQQGTMFSDGNLGPSYSADGVTIYLTDETTSIPDNHARSYGETLDSWNSGTVRALHTGVSDNKSLTFSIGSDCKARSELTVSIDKDDNGIFETSAQLDAIDPESYVDKTAGFAGSSNRGQAEVNVDAANAGGRYVGIKVISANVFNGQNSELIVRLPVVVEPTRPSGRYSGVSINRAAEFTESADVKLGLIWPAGAITADISNDGGFEVSRNVPLSSVVNWRLSELTSGKVGSTVYVKFLGLEATTEGSWQETDIQPGPAYTDNITMDLTPPVVSTVDASVASAQSGALGALRNFAAKIQSLVTTQTTLQQVARIRIDASDAGSGVTAMQVTSDPAVPGAELPYQSSILMPVEKDTTAVRVKDSVGNWSPWKYVKIAGFIATAPSPSNPEPNQPSTPVTERPVTNPPAVGSVPAPAAAPAPVAPPLPMQVAVKAKTSSAAVAASLGAAIPAKAKVTLTVAKTSKNICKVSGGKLVALKPGNCAVTVSVQAPKPKGSKKPKAVKTSGIVAIG